MKTQSSTNHVRVHPVYHYVAVPVSLVIIPVALINLYVHFTLGSGVLVIVTILLHLVIFLARDYAKKNQDRIIRLELRLRYFQLTQNRLDDFENQYALGQLLALRFASDEELIKLWNTPETKNKTSDEIKRQIKQWKPDWMRV